MDGQNLRQRRSRHVCGYHPGPVGTRIRVDNLCRILPADLLACLYLEAKTSPEFSIIGIYKIDYFNRDRTASAGPAKEHLADPAGTEAARQCVLPDIPRVTWLERVHRRLSTVRGEA